MVDTALRHVDTPEVPIYLLQFQREVFMVSISKEEALFRLFINILANDIILLTTNESNPLVLETQNTSQ